MNTWVYTYYNFFGGLGFWIIPFVLTFMVVIIVFVDSGSRRLAIPLWRLFLAIAWATLWLSFAVDVGEGAGMVDLRVQVGWFLLMLLDVICWAVIVSLAIFYGYFYRGLQGCVINLEHGAYRGEECPICRDEFAERQRLNHSYSNFFLRLWDGREMQLILGNNVVGRTPTCHIFLEPPSVSRPHAVLHVDGQGCHLINKSQHGTYVNGRRVNDAQGLSIGDHLRFGGVEATLLQHRM
jgi:hypothetical protein